MFKKLFLCVSLGIVSLTSSFANEVCTNASYYGKGFHGKRTANGETFNKNSLTAAHKTLPFNTKLLVKYGSRTVVVRINDRGPFIKGRGLDLSEGAAKQLGLIQRGVGKVCYTILNKSVDNSKKKSKSDKKRGNKTMRNNR